MIDLENPILTFPISNYSHCWKLQICIKWEKTCEIAAKCWVKLMYTLYKVLSKTHVHTLRRFDKFFLKTSSDCRKVWTWVLLTLCKVWTWLFVPQFCYYSSFQQWLWWAHSKQVYTKKKTTITNLCPQYIHYYESFIAAA